MNAIRILEDRALGERVVRRVFAPGLTVYAVRKPQFTRSYATVGVRYGSLDLVAPLGGRRVRLPAGTAHFLEHKIFETPEGDAFERFASRGASANAFTSFSSTRYLFGGSDAFAENLATLLEIVLSLHVTPENVAKEKGIVAQEIAMYRDDPEWRIYFGLLEALYARHPLRVDIAGTAESIARITPELLQAVHAAYYHPANMALAAVSREPAATTFRVVERVLAGRRFRPRPPLARPAFREPRSVPRAFRLARLSVKRPKLLVGFKDDPPRAPGVALLRREVASTLALDCLFGNSGSVFLDLYEHGLVDDRFSYAYNADVGYAFAVVGGETDDPRALRRALEAGMEAAVRRGVSGEVFARVRNKAFGDLARAYNAPDAIAHMVLSHHFRGTTVADFRRVLFELRPRDLTRRLRELLAPPARAYSVVEPR
jgi:predicted Zn-dependent peptidase